MMNDERVVVFSILNGVMKRIDENRLIDSVVITARQGESPDGAMAMREEPEHLN